MKLVVIYTNKNLSVKEYLNKIKSSFRDKIIKLNILIREYNLIINSNNQKLSISVQTENNKNKI